MRGLALSLLLAPMLLAGCTEQEPSEPLDAQDGVPSVWSVVLRNEGNVRMAFEVVMDGTAHEGGLEPGASWQRFQYLAAGRDHSVEVAVAHGDVLGDLVDGMESEASMAFRPESCRGSPAYHDIAGRPGREPLATRNGLSIDSNCG